ncbi:MAG: NAD(P)H-dependent oxidoreductase subunit E, partial [Chloroflexi bacterium]|nr:NAD(P)H-dependent oxidoreductase subunit E [Chloroflexota bacterium]
MNRDQEGIPTQGKNQADLLVLLEEAQHKFGYLSPEFMAGLSKSLDIPLSDVYGVASFYSFLSTKP